MEVDTNEAAQQSVIWTRMISTFTSANNGRTIGLKKNEEAHSEEYSPLRHTAQNAYQSKSSG